MAGPYLKSGETIVLTTDRVLIGDTEYDVILTSQRLALVDSGHTGDEPRVVPFATIISVKGAVTPAREPVITLSVLDPTDGDTSKTLDLIFSQQPYEDRSVECDLWVKKLIEHIVTVRQEPEETQRPLAGKKARGMQPSVRRFIAPDVPHPHTQVSQSPRPSEELLSAMQTVPWDSKDNSAERLETEELPEAGTRLYESEAEVPEFVPESEPEEKGYVPVKESPEPAPAGEMLIPEEPDLEYLAPEPASNMPLTEGKDPEPAAYGEQTPAATAPVTPYRELVPSNPEEYESFAGREDPVAGPVGNLEELSRQIEETEPLGAGEAEPVLPAASSGPSGLPETVVFPVLSVSTSSALPYPVHSAGVPAGTKPTVQPSAAPPEKQRMPVAGIIAVAVVIFLLLGAIVFLAAPPFLEQGKGGELQTPAPSLTPLSGATPVPTGGIPQQGIWIRVTYNGTYYGKYGNPGSLTEVRGSGDQVYLVKDATALVQAGFQKLDLSGNNLTVEVYNNGSMITQAFRNSPGAEVNILVNSTTGKPPYVPTLTTAAV